jgi:adenylate cyclase
MDMRGFTTMSEGRVPRAVVEILDRLFARATSAVESQGGLVDKFIGDAVLAVFGVPLPEADHAARGVEAARELLRQLRELNGELAAVALPPIAIGVGVHTGTVLAGRIGGGGRLEYTVIGDAVNVASRLQTATKDLGVPVAISAETWQALPAGARTGLRILRAVSVKGRTGPVTVYGLDAPA